ncbi:GtrA family protein [Polynucleobacter sp. TUM22923]|uniref:GtrA family protein n=1 Tax=Polynucleobacter sp. TUM22923 TaxID=3022126 RepID=UPI0033653D0C
MRDLGLSAAGASTGHRFGEAAHRRLYASTARQAGGPLISNQFTRFIFVGIINSIVGYGCFALFLYIGLHYTLSLFFATVAGVLFNFKSIGTLVFKSHNNQLIFRFIGSYSIIYLINAVGIDAFTRVGLTPYVGGVILILPMAALAFILNKRFVFNHV